MLAAKWRGQRGHSARAAPPPCARRRGGAQQRTLNSGTAALSCHLCSRASGFHVHQYTNQMLQRLLRPPLLPPWAPHDAPAT